MSHAELARHLELAAQRSPMHVFAFSDVGTMPLPPDGELLVGDVWWDVVRADSELAIRDALVNQRQDRKLAVVTRLRTSDLAIDVRMRLATYELLAFDSWESLKSAFQATRVDGRLRRNAALSRALLHCAANARFRPTTTGVLSADEAWGAYFRHGLDLDTEPTEIEGWVRWIIAKPKQIVALHDDSALYEQVVARAVERCGKAVRLVFQAVNTALATQGVDVAVRLHALAHVAAAGEAAERDGRVQEATALKIRLEPYFGNKLEAAQLRTFTHEVRRTHIEHQVGEAVDELLEACHAMELAVYSDDSVVGFVARQRALGDACRQHLRGEFPEEALMQRLRQLEAHNDFETKSDPEHVRALVRLTLRVAAAGETEHPTTSADLARNYIDEQSFIDALREELEFCDLGTELTQARSETLEAAYRYATVRNETFARALTADIAHHDTVAGAFFTHKMLSEVLAPLVRERPVLLLVIDGLSWFVLRRLGFDRAFEGWNAATPMRDGVANPMFATLPSITQFSRTALLTGKLQTGQQQNEKTGFEKSAALDATLKGKRAVLFHKAELDADGKGQVGEAVAKALREPKNRVVGVVLNAVDDQLGGADQFSFEWRVDAIPPLRSLLELAEQHKRDVLIVADHGHIWDRTSGRVDRAFEGARHRVADDAGDGEVRVTGPIVEAFGKSSLVLPYDEAIRYTGGKRGYHGGISLQEVVAPCVLLTRAELPEERWQRLSLAKPAWWEFREAETVHTVRHIAERSTAQGSLFAPPPQPRVAWIAQLLASELFEERRKLYASALTPAHIEALLATLDANGGRAHLNTLREASGLTPPRLRRRITALQQVLDRDGFAVLTFTEDYLQLDLDRLKKHFHLT